MKLFALIAVTALSLFSRTDNYRGRNLGEPESFGIIGAVNVYYNWQMGKDKITVKVAAWVFAAIFMILMGPFLQVLFGI